MIVSTKSYLVLDALHVHTKVERDPTYKSPWLEQSRAPSY